MLKTHLPVNAGFRTILPAICHRPEHGDDRALRWFAKLTARRTLTPFFTGAPMIEMLAFYRGGLRRIRVCILLVGSFLNVVIYRLPVMMEREWREQCEDRAESPMPNRRIARTRSIRSRGAAFCAVPSAAPSISRTAEHSRHQLPVAAAASCGNCGTTDNLDSLSAGRIH